MISLQSNEEIFPESGQPIFQVDRCFYDSAIKILNRYTDMLKTHSIRFFILLIIFLYQHYLRAPLQNDSPTVPYLLAALIGLQYARAKYSGYILKLFECNVPKIQQIANNLGHGKAVGSLISEMQDPCQQLYIFKEKSKIKVSKNVYSYKRNLQNSHQNLLLQQIQALRCQTDFQQALRLKWVDLVELALTVVTIQFTFILLQFYHPQLQIVFLCYLLSEFYIRSKIFLVMILIHILIALLPICCLCLCYYDRTHLKTYFKTLIKRQAKLPKVILATQEIIEKAQGNCSICIQEIALEQKVIILKCSDKHVFHEECIQDWSKIRKNCPICRADV